MLVIPVLTRTDQKKIPSICYLLILLNCLIFFFVQSDDSSLQEIAYNYYEESGLVEIELKAYQDYLVKKGDIHGQADLGDEREASYLLRKMFGDDQFYRLLLDDLIITPKDRIYVEWKDKRAQFDELLGQLSTHKYGYSPRENNLAGLFTCIFFHGDFMHLLGNMVFLYLVGAILEAAIGPVFFLGLYIVTGVCASGLFGLVYPSVPGPLIGASGAIAGLMGAYGVIFGLRKIRVFYSLGFYFNYAMVPALVLFPVWLINEFVQLYTNVGSNVAYVAHIGGLLSGVVIGFVYKPLLKDRIDGLFAKAEIKETVEALLDKGNELVVNFDLKGARQLFQKVLKIKPDHLQALRQLYFIDKSSPENEEFHQSTSNLMKRIRKEFPDEYLGVFEEYRALAKKPRVDLDMLEQLSFLYLRNGHHGKAAPMISTLFKKNPDSANLPGYLFQLAKGFLSAGKKGEALKCYQILARKYPTTQEGRTAAATLKQARGK